MENKVVEVAYLSYDGLTDPLGQSQIIPYVIGLSKQGYHFTIFSFEKTNRLIEKEKEIKIELNERNIKWHPLRYTKWPPVLSTLWDVWMLWRRVEIERKSSRFHIIHCRSYITSLVGLRSKKKFGTKFIFDMRGFWADERVEGGLWNLRNPLYKTVYNFFKKKERQFLMEADHTVSLTENAKQEILSWGLDCSPITVIPTGVDLELFNPSKIKTEEQSKLRQRLGIHPDDFVLLYLGSWGTWYLTSEMLNFFSELKGQKPSAKFLIVTSDNIELGDYALKKDVILTNAKRESVPLHISIANLAVCFIKTTFSKKASSATKIGEILAMNVPIAINKGWGDEISISNKQGTLNIFSVNLNLEYTIYESNFNVIEQYSLQKGLKNYLSLYSKL